MENEVTIESLLTENAVLKAELAEVNRKLSWFMEQLLSNRRKLYGQSSEKSVYNNGAVQLRLFPEEESGVVVTEIGGAVDGSAGTAQPQKKKPRKRGEMSTRLPANLPVETIECILPEDGRECPECGGLTHDMGRDLARRELKIIPAKAVITEYWRHAYSCRGCEKTAETVPVIKAPLPPQVIKGAMCAPETVAHIIVEKCVMGSPLYRQEKSWRQKGIPITRQTMANWLIRCSEDYFEPVYAELHRRLCLHQCLNVDETTFQVLKEPGKPAQSDSRMWLYRTGIDAEHPIVLYDYQPDRRQERPREFLAGFSGYIMTDGYSAYHNLPESIIVVGCFAHVRSKFVDALKCLKEKDQPGSLALTGKEYCDKLFDIDREIQEKSYKERYEIRNKKAAPVLDEFHAWLESVRQYASTKSKLGIAVGYALNQWKYLIRYLLDGRLECNNNRAERSIKPFVINRKNFLFADSVAGARTAAVLHSLTETAMENGLNPFEYLSYVLRSAAAGNIRADADLLNRLLPEYAPEFCRVPCIQSAAQSC
jgi:transposase